MSSAKRFHVLIATDGSTSARAALATAVRFPWPAAARGSAVVAKQVRAEYRRSILLTALDRTAEFTAQKAKRAMSARWPDSQARTIDAPPVEGILDEAKRVRADVIVLGWRGHGYAPAAAHRQRVSRCCPKSTLFGAGGQTATSRGPPRRDRPRWVSERRASVEVPRRCPPGPRLTRYPREGYRRHARPLPGAGASGHSGDGRRGSVADQRRAPRSRAQGAFASSQGRCICGLEER